jgi:intracellular multiplication protein IcmJ
MPKFALEPLVLSAKRRSWRMLDVHAGEHDRRFEQVRDSVLHRDDFTCRFCGFRALKWQEIHHRDDDHANNKPANLVTACCFCHQCHHLGLAGVKRRGTIIWCPEIGQADLHHICRAIFVAVANGGAQENAARSLYNALLARSTEIEQALGNIFSNPAAIGQGFLEMSDAQYAQRGKALEGVRLLPRMQAFGEQIAFWQQEPAVFGAIAEADWPRIVAMIDHVDDDRHDGVAHAVDSEVH